MNSNDISYIKKKLEEEKARIARLNELLQDPAVKEYLEVKGIQEKKSYTLNEWKTISEALKGYTIEKSNEIYVCTGAYYTACDICYQDTTYYIDDCDFDDYRMEYREYKNIETGRVVRAYSSLEYVRSYARSYVRLIKDFEKTATILNPTNSKKDENGYEKVRKEYFTAAVEHGDEVAQELILRKYPKLKPFKGGRRRR